MTPTVKRYVDREKLVKKLEAEGNLAAEYIRDEMDVIWLAMSDEEREYFSCDKCREMTRFSRRIDA